MLELFTLNSMKSDSVNNTEDEIKSRHVITIISIIIYFIFFLLAIFRALQCSNITPESRAIHLMFATMSPVMYILLSYSIYGFCK
jgi:uncharacterized membrane protein (DUF485 family)